MVSGLYGKSLSEVKDYWKRSSNGQSSFARNPEATSSWLALLSDHLDSSRLKPIVDYLPELLATKRLDRPSAQSVVDRLCKLCVRFPDPPWLFNACCGPAITWIDNLHPERIGGSGLSKTRDPRFWSDLRSYFDAVADPDMTYVVLDQRFNQVAAKHDIYSDVWGMLGDVSSVMAACELLFFKSEKTKQLSFYSHSQAVASTQLLDFDHVPPEILEMYTSWRVIFTALSADIAVPNEEWVSKPYRRATSWGERTVQISLVGHGRSPADDRCFSSVFYILAFKLFGKGYEPLELGAPVVDMSKTTPSRLEMDDDWGVGSVTM
ncbi:hypothetical protein J4E81_006574 [Alternaria sp. BMP 2799]|nr:hypothetical protein J4E81_006574 [Alternaria sp. BMP 2799]